MRITITVTDAPEGYDPHNLLRDLERQTQYALETVGAVIFQPASVAISGMPRLPREAQDETDF